jgi:hypothetical protein
LVAKNHIKDFKTFAQQLLGEFGRGLLLFFFFSFSLLLEREITDVSQV